VTEQPGQDSGDRTAGTEKYVFVYVYVYSMSINIGAAIGLIVPGALHRIVISSANYHSVKYMYMYNNTGNLVRGLLDTSTL
jgi:hypothetical protein